MLSQIETPALLCHHHCLSPRRSKPWPEQRHRKNNTNNMKLHREGGTSGVRKRPWRRYAVEIQDPFTKERHWWGTFDTAKEAALAVHCLIVASLGPLVVLHGHCWWSYLVGLPWLGGRKSPSRSQVVVPWSSMTTLGVREKVLQQRSFILGQSVCNGRKFWYKRRENDFSFGAILCKLSPFVIYLMIILY